MSIACLISPLDCNDYGNFARKQPHLRHVWIVIAFCSLATPLNCSIGPFLCSSAHRVYFLTARHRLNAVCSLLVYQFLNRLTLVYTIAVSFFWLEAWRPHERLVVSRHSVLFAQRCLSVHTVHNSVQSMTCWTTYRKCLRSLVITFVPILLVYKFLTATIFLSIVVWTPMINELTDYKETECRLVSTTSVPVECSFCSIFWTTYATTCIADYVDYVNNDDGSTRQAIIYSDAIGVSDDLYADDPYAVV